MLRTEAPTSRMKHVADPRDELEPQQDESGCWRGADSCETLPSAQRPVAEPQAPWRSSDARTPSDTRNERERAEASLGSRDSIARGHFGAAADEAQPEEEVEARHHRNTHGERHVVNAPRRKVEEVDVGLGVEALRRSARSFWAPTTTMSRSTANSA